MPTTKLSKPQQRLRLAAKIEAHGSLNMTPCPPCVASNSLCIVREGNARCSTCTRKNVTCGNIFSDALYDSMEMQKRELKAHRRAIQVQIAGLGQQLPAIEQQIDRLEEKQKQMVDRESEMMGELGTFSTSEGFVAVQWPVYDPDRFNRDQPPPPPPPQSPMGNGNGGSPQL
ncbi:hypothetical protein LTS15_011287 [Exophiala xenobiotica]|nr:hypothetical protein LTS15_011287 [Exophiala xenobiotica]